MKFGITCDYDERLHCEVDDGFAPALEGLTTCQINDRVPETCKIYMCMLQIQNMLIPILISMKM